MRLKPKIDNGDETNIFWITMTDLMTALVLVFMILFFYTYMVGNIERIEQRIIQQKATESLKETLKEQNIDASVDGVTGIVKISDLSLFDLNSWELSEEGKEYLSKFTPVYFDSLFTNEYMAENIDKILVQGHTDSQTFKGEFSEDQQYMKNMELSLKRAFSVAEFMTNTQYNKINGEKLRKMIIVEGASYSEPVLVDEKEDYAKSRRVELKLIMKQRKNNPETTGDEHVE